MFVRAESARMFAAMFALSLLTSVSANDVPIHASISEKGLVGFKLNDAVNFVIPAGHESGMLRYMQEYECDGPQGPQLPLAIKVEVDALEFSDVNIENGLNAVNIYLRNSSLNEEANVYLSLACSPLNKPKIINQNNRRGRPNIILPVPSVG